MLKHLTSSLNDDSVPYFLLQTDFEKDVDIACRSGKKNLIF